MKTKHKGIEFDKLPWGCTEYFKLEDIPKYYRKYFPLPGDVFMFKEPESYFTRTDVKIANGIIPLSYAYHMQYNDYCGKMMYVLSDIEARSLYFVCGLSFFKDANNYTFTALVVKDGRRIRTMFIGGSAPQVIYSNMYILNRKEPKKRR